MANEGLNIPFRPVKGEEENILATPYQDGYIYFATDTKKIYLDADGNEKLPMGGNSGIYYGQMTMAEDPEVGQTEFYFSFYDIEGNVEGEKLTIPVADDLILNIPDGCFYRVIDIEEYDGEDKIKTEKLTIAGSGSGGSGEGGSSNVGVMTLKALNGKSFTILDSGSCTITFEATAIDANGESTGPGSYQLIDAKNVTKVYGTGVVQQGENSIVINGQDLDIGENRLRLYVTMDTGGSDLVKRNLVYTIKTTQMKTTWDYDTTAINYIDSDFVTYYTVTGEGIAKTVKARIDDLYEITVQDNFTSSSQQTWRMSPSNLASYGLTHGAHKIELMTSAIVDGSTIEAESIIYRIIFVERSNKTPIISWGFFETNLIQYDTVHIPIVIYDKENALGDTVTLEEDGNLVTTWTEVRNQTVYTWSYTPTTAGAHLLAVHCGSTEFTHNVEVEALDLDNEEVSNYAFKFKASEFASNSAIQEWSSGDTGVTASFSDRFDWINGGLGSEDGRQYVCVKAGNQMTINYPVFKADPIASNAKGKTLKIIFKAMNCRDYDAEVMSCKVPKILTSISDEETLLVIDENTELPCADSIYIEDQKIKLEGKINKTYIDANDSQTRDNFAEKYVEIDDVVYYCKFEKADETAEEYYAAWKEVSIRESFCGLSLNAQSAELRSGGLSLDTQYCEEQIIEFEFDISAIDNKTTTEYKKNYVKLWIDGVPCNIVTYGSTEDFTVPKDTLLTIGSPDCDVYVYMIKLYEKGLTDDEHLQNFIADAPNAAEMIARYRRNDILDERGEISPSKLAKQNPDCYVHVYEISRMTKSKKDKVTGCTYDQYHGSDSVVLHADNVTIKVQGTSSENYVIAAANMDSEFTEGFIDGATGEKIDTWSMDGGKAIGCNYFCTKVNVASCENANNPLNQEWYNMFQPYKSVLRCKNEYARDTMQFTNGVLFFKDKNKETSGTDNSTGKDNNLFCDTNGYVNNPYPKIYAIANMGNSKKNVHVCHDLDNPKECCIEVKDNQDVRQQMLSYNYKGFEDNSDIGEEDGLFEFRYPDGKDNSTEEMRAGWNRLVKWMAESNPQPKYEEHIATTEREFKSFAFNQKTGKSVDVYKLNDSETAYELITSFDPAVNTYYTETVHVYGYTNLPLGETKHFDQKKLKGFRATEQKREDGELWQKDYEPLVTRLSAITKYAKDYTHDTYEYRMAKMLDECEDYLIMDAVLFHYLFIETHCLIDNVAKNTFWSTEDCTHWAPIKDYDNDTADGNDNNGKFTRTYGMEVQDKITDSAYVFNAHESVWLNFVDGLGPALDEFYTLLEEQEASYDGIENIKVWDPKKYTEAFNKWQGKIPERVWIEVYQRIYVRPYELYKQSMYLPMMEGGQKKYQRLQFETYQRTYMRSKHEPQQLSKDDQIYMRGNGSGVKGAIVPFKTYQDCYMYISVGSSNYHERVKRNTVLETVCPEDNLNNATISFSPGSVITEAGDDNMISAETGKKIGQLGVYNPEQLTLSSCKKLRKFVLATDDSSFTNNNLTKDLDFGACAMLEELYAANIKNYNSNLNLSACKNLRILNTQGTPFGEMTLPSNAPLTTINITAPVSLTAQNLRQVENFKWSLSNRLTTLLIENIDECPSPDFNSLSLVRDTLNLTGVQGGSKNLAKYQLHKVKWEMTDVSDVVLEKIPILDKLLEITPNTGNSKSSLTGTLTIAESAYNENNSIDIYNTYAQDSIYPNLDINFEGAAASLITVQIYDGDDNIFWERKMPKGNSIDEDFLSSGPYGALDTSAIYKNPSPSLIYSFTGSWQIYNADTMALVSTIIGTGDNYMPYYKEALEYNIIIKPVFVDEQRPYTLEFYDEDGVTLIDTYSKYYNTPWEDAQPGNIPYKPTPSNAALTAAYNFKGYSLIKGSSTVVPDTYKVTTNQKFYAVYEFVSDIRTIVHPEWFEAVSYQGYDKDQQWVNNTLFFDKVEDRIPQPQVQTNSGVYIRFKKGVKPKGKITIPAKLNEVDVVGIAQYFGQWWDGDSAQSGDAEITHVFCEKGSKLYHIENQAFAQHTYLEYFDFSQNTVRQIGEAAFKGCSKLQAKNFKLSENLYLIEKEAFQNAFTSDGEIVNIQIPSNVRYMYQGSFCYLADIKSGSTLTIGEKGNLSKLVLYAPNNGSTGGNEYAKCVTSSSDQELACSVIVFYHDKYSSSEQIVYDKQSVPFGVQLWQYFFNSNEMERFNPIFEFYNA